MADVLTAVRPASTFLEVPVNDIQPSPYQARREFNEEALKSLAESMRLEGLLEPIVVRKLDQETTPSTLLNPVIQAPKRQRFELISGERRLRAAKILGWKTIESKVIDTISDGEAAAKGMIENLQRENLNPMEEAEGFKALNNVDPKYWSQERIGQISGKTQTYVSRSMSLLDLPEEIQASMRARIFSRSHGLELMRLPTKELQLEIAKKIPGKLTWEETRNLINSILGGKNRAKAKEKKSKATPLQDPLQDLWPKVLANPAIGSTGSWSVQYVPSHQDEGAFGWQFWVSDAGLKTQPELAAWFRRMADALEPAAPVLVEEKTQEDPVSVVHPETDQQQIEPDGIRLPRNKDEEAELESLSVQGPGAVYAWIYGPDSIMARKMQGTRWSELRVHNPFQACREIVRWLRQARQASKGA